MEPTSVLLQIRSFLDTQPHAAVGTLEKNAYNLQRWDPDNNDLTGARNAHRTNTPAEFNAAKNGLFNWFEGDLRIDKDGVPVMSHDPGAATKSGLTLDEWLREGKKLERGLKVDVKEIEVLPQLLDKLEQSGIPQGRLMINVPALPVDEMLTIRSRFPDAWIAFGPPIREPAYHPEDIDKVIATADAIGGRVAFPIRWDLASDDVIHQLEQHGKVSIWTARTRGTPDDTRAETQRLRDRGVSGVIDLDPPLRWDEKLKKKLIDYWMDNPLRESFTRAGAMIWSAGAVDGVKEIPQAIFQAKKNGIETVVPTSSAALDAARRGAELKALD